MGIHITLNLIYTNYFGAVGATAGIHTSYTTGHTVSAFALFLIGSCSSHGCIQMSLRRWKADNTASSYPQTTWVDGSRCPQFIGKLSAIDRNHCPPSIGTSVRNGRKSARLYCPVSSC